MAENIDTRRRRLIYQSTRRGTKEADLVLGGFTKRYLPALGEQDIARLDALLAESDPDLMAWISGQEAPPERHDTALLRRILKFKETLLDR